MNGTTKCPICGKPYKWYSHYAGDQSACPKCRSEAEGGSLADRIKGVVLPAGEVHHEACSGGHTIPGLLGGWVCPCECHRESDV